MSTRPPNLGLQAILPREQTPRTETNHLAMRAIEVRFAAALIESAMPKSGASFGKGISGSIAREQLVNRIAQVLSESNALGIAKAAESREADPAALVNKQHQER